jgi:hypothetical protein
VLVLINTADHPTLVAGIPTGLAEGTRLEALMNVGEGPAFDVGRGGNLLVELPARASVVVAQSDLVTPPEPTDVVITVDTPITGETFTADATVAGRVTPADTRARDGDRRRPRRGARARAGRRWRVERDAAGVVVPVR